MLLELTLFSDVFNYLLLYMPLFVRCYTIRGCPSTRTEEKKEKKKKKRKKEIKEKNSLPTSNAEGKKATPGKATCTDGPNTNRHLGDYLSLML